MASDFKYSTRARNAMGQALTDLLDSGKKLGTLEIRTGNPPSSASTASNGILLAMLTLSAKSFGEWKNGSATINPVTPSKAVGTGEAGYYRIFAGGATNDEAIWQGTAGGPSDGADLTFDDPQIYEGGLVSCDSLTLTIAERQI